MIDVDIEREGALELHFGWLTSSALGNALGV